MRYEARRLSLRKGWTVWDTIKNTPAVVREVWQVGLSEDAAEDLAKWLNHWDRGHAPSRDNLS